MARQEPIKTLEELAAWRPIQASRHPVGLAPRLPAPDGAPRVLVCHDMQGGYRDDAYLHGNANSNAFRLFHWHLIDTFVYFSHHLVTIPPAGWIDLCHRHGVPCLGTFIAEWDSGLIAMQQLLSSEDAATSWADRLIVLAESYGFDGWLVNVEVELEASLVPALLAFVRQLNSRAHLQTVWYDSVTINGQLNWQNSVNSLNESLLLAAGAILLNYCWTPQLLQSTARRLTKLIADSANAGSTPAVYVGVDCFGRGCPGGGGFNCSEALQHIADVNSANAAAAEPQSSLLGVGLFAPGWAYETCPKPAAGADQEDDGSQDADRWESLVERTLEFWAGLTPLLGSPRAWTGRLNTSFCLGQGTRRWDRGRLVSANAWNSLWEAHQMPHYWTCDPDQHLSLCRTRAWQGGGCLRVALGSGVGGGCELPLFSLRLPAGRIRALKLVYSLDSVFEDRPLDPVTVCLVAKYRCTAVSDGDAKGGQPRGQQLIVLCHSSESRLSCSEMATVQGHYSAGGPDSDYQTLVFPRTVRREVEGDADGAGGGIVWHIVYTEASDPSSAIGSNPTNKDCYLEQICLFFILPSRLESPEPVCVYLGQVKVALNQ